MNDYNGLLEELQSKALSEEAKHLLEAIVAKEVMEAFWGPVNKQRVERLLKQAENHFQVNLEEMLKNDYPRIKQEVVEGVVQSYLKGDRWDSKINEIISEFEQRFTQTVAAKVTAAVKALVVQEVKNQIPTMPALEGMILTKLAEAGKDNLIHELIFWRKSHEDLIERVRALEQKLSSSGSPERVVPYGLPANR